MITVKELTNFLKTKSEHYPLSDDFMLRYRQKSGGYIKNASNCGHSTDQTKCEPNQEWHWLESWLPTKSPEADAGEVIYPYIQCPELWIWLLEACEFEQHEIQEVKQLAEAGKQNSLRPAIIGRQIREIVSWDDIAKRIKEQ